MGLLRDCAGVVAKYQQFLKLFPRDTVALRMLLLCQWLGGHSKEGFLAYESVKNENWECTAFKCYYCLNGSWSGTMKPSAIEPIWGEARDAEPLQWIVHHAGAHVLLSRPLDVLIKYMEEATQSWDAKVGPGYRSLGFFHLALLYVYSGQTARGKSLFYSDVWQPGPSRSGLLTQMNAIGLLWVLQLADPSAVSVSDWEDVGEHVLESKLHLDDLSIMPLILSSYCLFQSGKHSAALECQNIMANRKGDPQANEAGMALLEGCSSFCRRDYKQASKLLAPFASEENSTLLEAATSNGCRCGSPTLLLSPRTRRSLTTHCERVSWSKCRTRKERFGQSSRLFVE